MSVIKNSAAIAAFLANAGITQLSHSYNCDNELIVIGNGKILIEAAKVSFWNETTEQYFDLHLTDSVTLTADRIKTLLEV